MQNSSGAKSAWTRASYYIINFYLLIAVFSFVPILSFSQGRLLINSTLDGQIIDAKTKEGLVGASLRIKGLTHATTTDINGKFQFVTGQSFPYTLVITYVGYEPQEVLVSGSPIVIALVPLANQLSDVVVVGYGTQRRKDLTGSVSSVSAERLNQPTSSPDNLLRGAVAGVNVTQSSGAPGASSSIRIRGGNSVTGGNEPLYVIDGFPVYNDNSSTSATGVAGSGAGLNALSTINPNDIESMDVLKDASATAIYGSRGANGVVLITTKKGKRGANNVNYHVYTGVQKLSKSLSLLNGREWALFRNDIIATLTPNVSNPLPFTQAQIDGFGEGHNWQAAAFRNAPVQNHELSFSGGDEKSRYAISGNYLNQDGILVNTNFTRYAGRFNYERDFSTKFKIGINVTGSRSVNKGATGSTGSNNYGLTTSVAAVVGTAPTIPIKNADGSYNLLNPYAAGIVANPIQDLYVVTNQTNVTRTLGNFFGEYKILPGLTAKVSIGADLLNTRQNYYAPSNSTNGYVDKGYAVIGTREVNSWLNENTLNYSKTFDKHAFSALVGYTTQYAYGQAATSGSKNFVSDATTFNNLAGGTTVVAPTSDAYSWALNSYLARVNYSYDQKYNLTVSLRADGSSRFGDGNKWGYFPSAGFSWNASDEDFLKDNKTINNLKLRLSAGVTGNQEIGQYQSMATLSPVSYFFNRTQVTGFAASRLSNQDLKWEKTAQYNAGVDLGLFDNRITLVFDAYYKRTNDLLLSVPIPTSSGFSTSLQNIGSVENKGIEIAINTDNIRSESFSWKTSVIYAKNVNKVLSLGNNRTSYFPTVPSTALGLLQPINVVVGQPLGTFWGYQTNGIFQSQAEITNSATLDSKANTRPGDQKYIDVVPDGVINSADKVNLGTAQPKFIGSINNTFAYKNFDLSVFLQGSYGGKIYNALRQQLDITSLVLNTTTDLLDRWTPTNPSNSVPRATNQPVAQMSNRFIEDGSFLRLKTVTFGYSFKADLLAKLHVKQLRIYVSAQNLHTWTKYKGYDPEVSSFEQNNTLQGIDFGAYPNSRTFLAGLNITL